MAFGGIRQWTDALEEATEPACVRVLRTKVQTLPVAEGAAMAAKRYHARQKRAAGRKRTPKATPPGQLEGRDWA